MARFASDLIRSRTLIVRLARSQFALRYRQSILGLGWSVIQPVALMLVFTFVAHKGAGVKAEGDVPYALWVYCALLPWQLFQSSLAVGVPSLVQFASVIRKVYVPREAFPLSAIASAFIDFALAGVVFVGLMLHYRESVTFGAAALWAVPVLACQVLFTCGIVLLGSALCVKYRDIRHGVAFGLTVWLLASPVWVSMTDLSAALSARAAWLPTAYIAANPMAAYLDAYRKALLFNQAPDLASVGVAAAVSAAWFVFGYAYFKAREMRFADVV